MKRNGGGLNSSFGPEYEDDDYEDDDAPAASNRTRARASSYRPAYDDSPRRPAAERDTAFHALLWLLEGATGVMEELRHNDLGLSEEFWVHAYSARREGLLAMRAVLDEFIEHTEAQQTADREREQRQTRRGGINVDF